MRTETAMLALVAALATAGAAFAQDYPSRPVTIVAPFAPGGGVDLGARNLAEGLSQLWGQAVVVENKPGAGSQIGTAEVAAADPDGYTILFDSSAFATLPATRPGLPYDPLEDFQPAASAGDILVVVVAGPRVAAQDFKDFVAESKTRQMFYASSGNGSGTHLLAEAVNLAAGTDLEAVHYKSGSEALVDTAAGRADIYVGVLSSVLPLLQDGSVRLLATMSKERVAGYPDVATLDELGYDNAVLSSWWGVFVPDGTPEAVVAKINAGVTQVLESPDQQAFLERSQAVFYPQTVAEFTENVGQEIAFWTDLASRRGISEE